MKKCLVLDGWMDGLMGEWVGGCKSRFKDCLHQSKINLQENQRENVFEKYKTLFIFQVAV